MKARRLISTASLGPEALKVIGQAFDGAWQELEPGVSNRPEAVEAARLRLANIVLSLAGDDVRDPVPLKDEAVRRFSKKRQSSN
jgi:hypothetical protein